MKEEILATVLSIIISFIFYFNTGDRNSTTSNSSGFIYIILYIILWFVCLGIVNYAFHLAG